MPNEPAMRFFSPSNHSFTALSTDGDCTLDPASNKNGRGAGARQLLCSASLRAYMLACASLFADGMPKCATSKRASTRTRVRVRTYTRRAGRREATRSRCRIRMVERRAAGLARANGTCRTRAEARAEGRRAYRDRAARSAGMCPVREDRMM
jgi:hypothetical protein